MPGVQRKIKLVECPRDAMQGWPHFIPTEKKIEYLDSLMDVGFDTLDFGSFVSPKAIPQMADTSLVVKKIRIKPPTKLLAIIANERGAMEALGFGDIQYLGYPFSISETFQQRNTNASIATSFERLKQIQQQCTSAGRQLVVYLSMGFGNPYGDEYSEQVVFAWAQKLVAIGIRIISVADTVGVATPEQVSRVTTGLIKGFPSAEIGVHLHSAPANWKEKLEAALDAGCTRIDGAIKGIGGCPFADDVLVGNMDTGLMAAYLDKHGYDTGLDLHALDKSTQLATQIFI